MSSTAVYFLAEVGAGFGNIGQEAFGLGFKFIGENIPFIVLPPLVLYSIHLPIDHLTRLAGPRPSARRQSEDPLHDDVALNLRRATGDRAGETAEVAKEAKGEHACCTVRRS